MKSDAGAAAPPSGERRCLCGQLLARLSKAGVEIKCKRCRRVVVIPWRNVDEN